MKCQNCSEDALFEYRITFKTSQFYCGKHLPRFLNARKSAGLLDVTDAFKQAKKEAMEILKPSTSSEESEVVEEKPKPKKKASKKKSE